MPDTSIRAAVVPYDPEHGHLTLAGLRKENRGAYAFARTREGIICLPRARGAPSLSSNVRDFELNKNLNIVAALLREGLIDYFHGLGRSVVGYRPISFLAESKHDLLRKPLVRGRRTPAWLSVIPRFSLDVRLFFFGNRPPFLGLALDTRTRKRITATCSELLEEGIDLKGLYVGNRPQGDDPRVQSRFSLLGRVTRVDNGVLILADTRDDLESASAAEVFLEESPQTFSELTKQVFGDQTEEAIEAIFQRSASRRVGPAKLADIERFRSYLAQQEFLEALGLA